MLCNTAQYTKVCEIGPSSRVVREAALGRRGWGVGAAGADCACGRRARPREIAELHSGGQERALSVCGGNSHPSSTAPCCSCAPCSPRRPVVRRAPAGAQVPSNCCGRVIEFWMCQHRHIQKTRRADQLIRAQTALCSGVGCGDESDEGAAIGSSVGAPLGSAVGVGDGSDVGSARRQRARQQRAARLGSLLLLLCIQVSETRTTRTTTRANTRRMATTKTKTRTTMTTGDDDDGDIEVVGGVVTFTSPVPRVSLGTILWQSRWF